MKLKINEVNIYQVQHKTLAITGKINTYKLNGKNELIIGFCENF